MSNKINFILKSEQKRGLIQLEFDVKPITYRFTDTHKLTLNMKQTLIVVNSSQLSDIYES